MAVSSRKVQNKRDSNGVLTGKAGTVYDVNIKYTGQDGKKKSYAKKGFATKKEATQHEAEMKAKLANPIYSPVVASQGKQTVKEYLEEWVENHGKANLRPSTFAGYKSHIRNHIVPYIGHVQLNQLTPAMLDNMFQQLFDKGLSNSTVRYAQRILSVSMEHARKYRYIEHNPARDIITKFGKQAKTPDPYTIEQMQTFMSNVIGTEWEMPVVHLHDGLHGETKSALCTLQHPTDTVELVLVDNVPEEQVGRELNGNLPNIPGGTFMLLPYMLQLLTGYQHQVIITDNLGRIAHHTAYAGSMFREVQFILCVTMDGVGKFCFATIGNIETVTFRQRGYFPHDIVLVFHRHWLKKYHATNILILFNPTTVPFVTFRGNNCYI